MWRRDRRALLFSLVVLIVAPQPRLRAQPAGPDLPGWNVADWTGRSEGTQFPGGQVVVLADEIQLEGSSSGHSRNGRIILVADHLRVGNAARINATNLGEGRDVAIVVRRLTCEGGTLELDVSARDVTEVNSDRPGSSYRDFETTPDACRDACRRDPQCQVWTWRPAPSQSDAGPTAGRPRVRDHRKRPAGAAAPVVAPVPNTAVCSLKKRARPSQRVEGMRSGVRPRPGRITLVAERVEGGDSCIVPRFSAQPVSPVGHSRAEGLKQLGVRREALAGTRPAATAEADAQSLVKKTGPDAFMEFVNLSASERDLRERVVSLWTTAMLRSREVQVKVELGRSNYQRALALLAAARQLTDTQRYPIHPAHLDRYGELVAALNRDAAQIPAFVIEPFTLDTPWGTRQVDVWLEAATGTAFVPPTMLLVEPIRHAGKRGLAYLSFDPARPDQLILHANLRLRQDPWLLQQLRPRVAEMGWKMGTVASTWRFDVSLPPLFGVRDQKIVQSGDLLELGLTLDAAQGNVALSRLIGSGANLELGIASSALPGLSSSMTIPLSLARSTEHQDILVEEGSLRNAGHLPVRVTHLQLRDGSLRALEPPLEVSGGHSAPLPADLGEARLVPGGIEYRLDGQSVLDYVVAADASPLVDTILVTNLLGPDPARGGALEYVELDIEYVSEGAEPVRVKSLRLASRGTMESEKRLSFVRTSGDRTVRIEGRAYYEGGSSQQIGPVATSSATIKITEESLP